jgi:hypothetical protein
LSEFAGSCLFDPVHRRATWQGESKEKTVDLKLQGKTGPGDRR